MKFNYYNNINNINNNRYTSNLDDDEEEVILEEEEDESIRIFKAHKMRVLYKNKEKHVFLCPLLISRRVHTCILTSGYNKRIFMKMIIRSITSVKSDQSIEDEPCEPGEPNARFSQRKKTYEKAFELYINFDILLNAYLNSNRDIINASSPEERDQHYRQYLHFYYSNIPLTALSDVGEFLRIYPYPEWVEYWNSYFINIIDSWCIHTPFITNEEFDKSNLEFHELVTNDFIAYTKDIFYETEDQHILSYNTLRKRIQQVPILKIIKTLLFNSVFKQYIHLIRNKEDYFIFLTLGFIKQNYHFEATNGTIVYNFIRGLERLQHPLPLVNHIMSYNKRRHLYHLIMCFKLYNVLHMNGYPVHNSGALMDYNKTHIVYAFYYILTKDYFKTFFGSDKSFSDSIDVGSIDKDLIRSAIQYYKEFLYSPLSENYANSQVSLIIADKGRITYDLFKVSSRYPYYSYLAVKKPAELILRLHDPKLTLHHQEFDYDLLAYTYRVDRCDLTPSFIKFHLLYKRLYRIYPCFYFTREIFQFIREEIPQHYLSSWFDTCHFMNGEGLYGDCQDPCIRFFNVHILNHIDMIYFLPEEEINDLADQYFKALLYTYMIVFYNSKKDQIPLDSFFEEKKYFSNGEEYFIDGERWSDTLKWFWSFNPERLKFNTLNEIPVRNFNPYNHYCDLMYNKAINEAQLIYPYNYTNYTLTKYFNAFYRKVKGVKNKHVLFDFAWNFIQRRLYLSCPLWKSITEANPSEFIYMAPVHIINNLDKVTLSETCDQAKAEIVFKASMRLFYEYNFHDFKPNEWHYHEWDTNHFGKDEVTFTTSDLYLLKRRYKYIYLYFEHIQVRGLPVASVKPSQKAYQQRVRLTTVPPTISNYAPYFLVSPTRFTSIIIPSTYYAINPEALLANLEMTAPIVTRRTATITHRFKPDEYVKGYYKNRKKLRQSKR